MNLHKSRIIAGIVMSILGSLLQIGIVEGLAAAANDIDEKAAAMAEPGMDKAGLFAKPSRRSSAFSAGKRLAALSGKAPTMTSLLA